MKADFHVHSTYSDGALLPVLLPTAASIGLEAVGITDHCVVSERPEAHERRRQLGFSLDATYQRRRKALDYFREEYDVRIYDAVEMDYHPADVEVIDAFLDEATFDYSLGSVHTVSGLPVGDHEAAAQLSEDDRDEIVDEYFDRLVALVNSELFDVAAHLDLVERNPALRGRAANSQYERVAEAFASSRTVPEINAGSVTGDYGDFHPREPFLNCLLERDVQVVLGTDTHQPGSLKPRKEALEDLLVEKDVAVCSPLD